MTNRVTIRQIAEELNISKSLVALALSDKYGVSENNRARIMLKAYEMGYDFDYLKRRSGAKRRITLLLSQKLMLTSTFWKDVINGIQQEVLKKGFILEILLLSQTSPLSDLYIKVNEKNCCGLLLLSDYGDEIIDKIQNMEMPIVLIDARNYSGNTYSQVRATNYSGGYAVGRYLLEKGHKNVAFYANLYYGESFRQRFSGFRAAIKNIGDSTENLQLISIDKTEENAENMDDLDSLRQVLSSEKRPTAIFCGNDTLADCAARVIVNEFNLKVPHDISLVGFDNIDISLQMTPKLTTVNIDRENIGKIATEQLFLEISEKERCKVIIEVETKLVERDSVADIKDNH